MVAFDCQWGWSRTTTPVERHDDTTVLLLLVLKLPGKIRIELMSRI